MKKPPRAPGVAACDGKRRSEPPTPSSGVRQRRGREGVEEEEEEEEEDRDRDRVEARRGVSGRRRHTSPWVRPGAIAARGRVDPIPRGKPIPKGRRESLDPFLEGGREASPRPRGSRGGVWLRGPGRVWAEACRGRQHRRGPGAVGGVGWGLRDRRCWVSVWVRTRTPQSCRPRSRGGSGRGLQKPRPTAA